VVNADWLVFLCTIVHFSLESNQQPLCHYASKHLDLSFEKCGSLICCETDVPPEHRCLLWGFLSVVCKFRLSAFDIFLFFKFD